MSSTVCHLLDLPPELRVEIYKYTFTTNGSEAYESLLQAGPDNRLRATCRFVYHDSDETYNHFIITYQDCRSDTLAAMFKQAAELMVTPGAHCSRAWGLSAATKLLSGVKEPGLPRSCGHTCSNIPFDCHCEEHETCFTCGRWLALSAFCELYLGKTDPLRLVRGDGRLTRLGNIVETHTGKFVVGYTDENLADIAQRYPPHKERWRFGQYWWRFELERQKMKVFIARVQKDAGEVLRKEDLWDDDPPAKDMSDPQLERLSRDLQKAKDLHQFGIPDSVEPANREFDYASFLDDVNLIIRLRTTEKAVRARKAKAEKKRRKKGKK